MAERLWGQYSGGAKEGHQTVVHGLEKKSGGAGKKVVTGNGRTYPNYKPAGKTREKEQGFKRIGV